MRQETRDRRLETRDRRQETRDTRQETRDQRQETRDQRLETRDLSMFTYCVRCPLRMVGGTRSLIPPRFTPSTQRRTLPYKDTQQKQTLMIIYSVLTWYRREHEKSAMSLYHGRWRQTEFV